MLDQKITHHLLHHINGRSTGLMNNNPGTPLIGNIQILRNLNLQINKKRCFHHFRTQAFVLFHNHLEPFNAVQPGENVLPPHRSYRFRQRYPKHCPPLHPTVPVQDRESAPDQQYCGPLRHTLQEWATRLPAF